MNRNYQACVAISMLMLLLGCPRSGGAQGIAEIVVTNDIVLEKGATLRARLRVTRSDVFIDGNGAVLLGPGTLGDTNSLAGAGVGVLVQDVSRVSVRNLRAKGFATGLVLRRAKAIQVSDCDFSDNYHNPGHGWGELPARGGILLEQTRFSVVRSTRANNVWDGIHLIDSDDNLIETNDFSNCSNTCAKLWKSSRNKFLHNNLSYGLRIDRSAGEVHARDSTGVLIETGSNDNYWFRNDITHGGDGIFIRPLNRWVSTGNVFVENDTSYANNNCIESWSPGNTYIRNKANHGSYGFWLGGSDHTVLIGNEAAYNGLTNGFHNAPEPGFRHGGIVIVAGPSSHTILEGNYVHHNNGAGIAFRGDTGSQGRKWRTEHWVVQRNRIEDNRFGIWGALGNGVLLAGNTFARNGRDMALTNVLNLAELPRNEDVQTAPIGRLSGPDTVLAGTVARFDAGGSKSTDGRSLTFQWLLGIEQFSGPVFERRFAEPGYYRLGLTVHNGALADIAWRDLLVVGPVGEELGTEGQAARWVYELEGDPDRRGRVHFADESGALIGRSCLRITPDPYPGQYVYARLPAGGDARWDFRDKETLRFWIKAQNPNVTGWQNSGPVVTLFTSNGEVAYRPAGNANLLNDPPYSEGRWLWIPVKVPLAGNADWERTAKGDPLLGEVTGIGLAFDSWGWEPFTIWLDGLSVE